MTYDHWKTTEPDPFEFDDPPEVIDMDDIPHYYEWRCEHCGAGNSMWDAICQFCDMGGNHVVS